MKRMFHNRSFSYRITIHLEVSPISFRKELGSTISSPHKKQVLAPKVTFPCREDAMWRNESPKT